MKRCCTSLFSANARILPKLQQSAASSTFQPHNKSHKIFSYTGKTRLLFIDTGTNTTCKVTYYVVKQSFVCSFWQNAASALVELLSYRISQKTRVNRLNTQVRQFFSNRVISEKKYCGLLGVFWCLWKSPVRGVYVWIHVKQWRIQIESLFASLTRVHMYILKGIVGGLWQWNFKFVVRS